MAPKSGAISKSLGPPFILTIHGVQIGSSDLFLLQITQKGEGLFLFEASPILQGFLATTDIFHAAAYITEKVNTTWNIISRGNKK